MSILTEQIQEKPKNRLRLWTTGMALFSMFFGAGNIIFPLVVGSTSKTMTSYAIAGLSLSAVLFPLLGLIAMLFYNGNLRSFLSRLGPIPAAILLFLLFNIQGPLIVLPRLVTLMYASIAPYTSLSLGVFSVVICAIIFVMTVRQTWVVDLLGKMLTPFLLISLGVLIAAGFFQGSLSSPEVSSGLYHFKEGLKGGYLTTDLISALLFATIILPHLRQGTERMSPQEADRTVKKNMLIASCIAAGLLMLTYIGLCGLAARQEGLADVPPEAMLQVVSTQVLGPVGGIVAAVAVFLACLTTAISLSAVFAKYLGQDLLKNVFPQKNESLFWPLAITLAITAVMSNLGFGGLLKLAGPLMQIMYPALIVLCVTNIAYSLYRVKPVKLPVFATLGLSLAGFCFI